MMASAIDIRCPYCPPGVGWPEYGEEPSSYWCRNCRNAWRVKSAARKSVAEASWVTPKEEGFIPWDVLDPGVKRAFAETGKRLRSGRGPGSSVGRATKILGMRPCRGCRGRIKALDDLGWLPVVLYTGVVAGFTFAGQWLAF